MNNLSLLTRYSIRIVRRQWRRFVLPFSSLTITGLIFLIVLLLTNSGDTLVKSEARALLGGDVVIESSQPFIGKTLLQEANVEPDRVSSQIEFTATLANVSATAPFTIYAVDEKFPLYGDFRLASSNYTPLTAGEILLDENGYNRLGIKAGDTVTLGEGSFTVRDMILNEPLSLFGAFSIFPRAYINLSGFTDTALDPSLLQVEYRYAAALTDLDKEAEERLADLTKQYPEIDVDIAGREQRGLQFGLQTITDFLIITVLITSVLAAVNIYASTLYLISVERRSLAVLLALGLTKRGLVTILGISLCLVIVIACSVAIMLGWGIFTIMQEFVSKKYELSLPPAPILLDSLITFFLLLVITIASFVPAVRKSMSLEPRQILIGAEPATSGGSLWRSVLAVSGTALLPLLLLASFLLGSVGQGAIVLGSIIGTYLLVATGFAALLSVLYRQRSRLSFFWRTIVNQKVADGLFGIISTSSLFVALTALFSLTLLQVSLERYLNGELANSVPTTYVLDVQPSQKEALLASFPDFYLYGNLGARIIAIDGLLIQEELAKGNPEINGELGREFNLTARRDLLTSESITDGRWSNGQTGEVSVDKQFASRAGISLGSTIEFSIQGFPVNTVVTSLRDTDSRSGLPFFYFVMAPEDVAQFPSVYFGHADYNDEEQKTLGAFLSKTMPNVSMIETDTIGPILARIVKTLLILVLTVTLPPLLIATLLIATLVVSNYAIRRRVVARLRAIGLTKREAFFQYLAETVSITIVASFGAYLISIVVVSALNYWVLDLERATLIAPEVIMALILVIGLVTLLASYLFKTDTMQLRELLSYE